MQPIISLVTTETILPEMTAIQALMSEGKEYVLEVKEKTDRAAGGTIKPLVIERIVRGVDNKTILAEVAKLVPSSKTTKESIAWYRSQMNKGTYYPLIKAVRALGLGTDLDDKEMVKQFQAWGTVDLAVITAKFAEAKESKEPVTEEETSAEAEKIADEVQEPSTEEPTKEDGAE